MYIYICIYTYIYIYIYIYIYKDINHGKNSKYWLIFCAYSFFRRDDNDFSFILFPFFSFVGAIIREGGLGSIRRRRRPAGEAARRGGGQARQMLWLGGVWGLFGAQQVMPRGPVSAAGHLLWITISKFGPATRPTRSAVFIGTHLLARKFGNCCSRCNDARGKSR